MNLETSAQHHGEDEREFMASYPQKCRRAVQFSQKVTVILVSPSVDRDSIASIRALWYIDAEYEAIKCDNRNTLKLMGHGVHVSDNDEHVCYRGLEHRTKAGISRKIQRREDAYDAVLTEQERQIVSGKSDPRPISKRYLETSGDGKLDALVAADADANFAVRQHAGQLHSKKMSYKVVTRYHCFKSLHSAKTHLRTVGSSVTARISSATPS